MTRLFGRCFTRDAAVNAALLTALLAVICFSGWMWGGLVAQQTLATMFAAMVGVCALAVFSGNSGALSFGHVAFMAAGAQTAAYLTIPASIKIQLFPLLPMALVDVELSFLPTIITTFVVGGLLAYLCGFVIAKLSSATIPIATLGLLIIVNSVLIGAEGLTRGSQAVYAIPKAATFPTIAACAMIAVSIAALFKYSSIGLSLRAAREDEPAANSSGVDVPRLRHVSWTLSGAIAATAGALMALNLSVFSPKDYYFDLTFELIVMLIVGGMHSVTGAVIGTIAVTIVIEVLRRIENGVSFAGLELPQIFGMTTIGLALLVMLTLYLNPSGLLGYREIGSLVRRKSALSRPDTTKAGSDILTSSTSDRLTVDNIRKIYGGIRALDGVSLSIQSGEIVGLIGPNGSGKSTFLACISGVQKPTSGTVTLNNTLLSDKSAMMVARSGLARNFQNIRIFQQLTALENVTVSVLNIDPEISLKTAKKTSLALLKQLGIEALADRLSGELAYGQQRRVEIARALALRPRFLLLDEPAAGMNETETMDLLSVLHDVVRGSRIGLIIIDHDIPFIMKLCDRVLVLHQGQLLAEGTPEEIQKSQTVKEAYFGRRAH